MPISASRAEYAGIFLVAMATLMFELLLTRIFSVTLWAHLAFVAVSIAMFGMTLGAVLLYLCPRWFTPARARLNLAISSLLFGVTAVWAVHFHLRFAMSPVGMTSPLSQLALAYGLIAIPFVFSGIATAIVLTQFPRHINRLYADLAGAACGCVLLVGALDWLGGPRTVFLVAGAATLASLGFMTHAVAGLGRRRALATIGLIVVAFAATCALALDKTVREVAYRKGAGAGKLYYEKWNSYSRIAVAFPTFEHPFGWGLSDTFHAPAPLNQLRLNIDASAETVLTKFDGDLDAVRHLKYDVTNIAHYVIDRGRIFVIGAGGGRDVLSSLVFGQKEVVAVEMNGAILDAVNGVFGDLTGHLDGRPGVRFVNDEARSYLARTEGTFDLIQVSLIDTWAATTAGAFVLTENTLYTTEAWRLFYSRLTDNGIVSMSRWYTNPPSEMYKVAALAANTLRLEGIANPRAHLIVVATPRLTGERAGEPGVGTLLMKRTPFTAAEISRLQAAARTLNFDVPIDPGQASDQAFAAIANPAMIDSFIAGYNDDLSSPDDNRPFFFKMDSTLLRGLFTYVAALTLAFIVVPVFLKAEPQVLRSNLTLTTAFSAIGVGFMLVEIVLLQRLTFLLGHPTFSLSVVLFGLLISSGLGSFASGQRADGRSSLAAYLGALVVALAIVGIVTPAAIRAFQGTGTTARIAVALVLLVPAGFFMGMAFPVAMRIASMRAPSLTPWFWATNGATSVTASVLAVWISSTQGISAAWWAGVACYIVAAVAIVKAARTVDAGGTTQADAADPALADVVVGMRREG